MNYQDYFKKIQPWMLDESGRFKGPQSGVNYAFEGMTPEQAYAAAMQQYSAIQDRNSESPDWLKNKSTQDQMLDPSWKEGVVDTKKGVLGNWGVPLAMLAAPYVASQLGFGAEAGTGGADGAVEFGAGGDGMEAFTPQYVPKVDPTSLAVDPKILGGSAFTPMEVAQPSLSAFNAGTTAAITNNMAPATSALAQWAKNNPTLAQLGGAALGALSAKDTTTSASSTKDPWAPAQPYLLQNLKQNQAMSDYYNANPFSQEQQNAYQGLLNTVANSQAAGNGLLSMASNFGRSNRGVVPQSAALPVGTQAPAINWSQYANIGRK